MNPSQPASLFPYTTLFRSPSIGRAGQARKNWGRFSALSRAEERPRGPTFLYFRFLSVPNCRAVILAADCDIGGEDRRPTILQAFDRAKGSTRWNVQRS